MRRLIKYRAAAGRGGGGSKKRGNKGAGNERHVVIYDIGGEKVFFDPNTGQYHKKNGDERPLEHTEKRAKRKIGDTHVGW